MSLLPIHIIAGTIALVSGAVALYARKGGKLHRKGGIIFVYAMLVLSASGAVIAIVKLNRGNVMGASLTFYLITTALLTTRRRVIWADLAAMLMGLGVGIMGFTFGFMALHSASGTLDAYPPPLYFIFGTIALLSAPGDARMMWRRGLEGRHRIARHLWRMCFGMFIATGSFFLGQAKIFPKPMRIIPLLIILAVLPLLLMMYWLVRVSFTQRYRRRAAALVKDNSQFEMRDSALLAKNAIG